MSENRLKIGISQGGGSVISICQIFMLKETSPPIIFAWLDRPMNALQLCLWQFSHKENW